MESRSVCVPLRFVHGLPRGWIRVPHYVLWPFRRTGRGQRRTDWLSLSLSHTGSLKRETIPFALFIETTLTDAVCNIKKKQKFCPGN